MKTVEDLMNIIKDEYLKKIATSYSVNKCNNKLTGELMYKHSISHSMSGMKVYIYMVLIIALMFLAYKIKSNLSGFKIPLFQFTIALKKSFIKTLIILPGNHFSTVKHLL